MPRWWFYSSSPRPLALTIFPPLFCDATWTFGVCVWYWGTICGWALNWHLFSAPWEVVSFSISHLHCTVSLPRWGPRAALIYRCRDRDWEGSLSVQQNNNSRFLPGACELPSPGFLARFTVPGLCFLLWRKPDVQSEMLATPPAFLAPMGLSYHNSHCYSSQVLSWGRLLQWFTPGSLYVLFSSKRASQQGGSFLVRTLDFSVCCSQSVCWVQQ